MDAQPKIGSCVRFGLSSPAARHHGCDHHGNKFLINHSETPKEVTRMSKGWNSIGRQFKATLKIAIWLHSWKTASKVEWRRLCAQPVGAGGPALGRSVIVASTIMELNVRRRSPLGLSFQDIFRSNNWGSEGKQLAQGSHNKLKEKSGLELVSCPLNLLVLPEPRGFYWKDNESSRRHPLQVSTGTLKEGVAVYPHGCHAFS